MHLPVIIEIEQKLKELKKSIAQHDKRFVTIRKDECDSPTTNCSSSYIVPESMTSNTGSSSCSNSKREFVSSNSSDKK